MSPAEGGGVAGEEIVLGHWLLIAAHPNPWLVGPGSARRVARPMRSRWCIWVLDQPAFSPATSRMVERHRSKATRLRAASRGERISPRGAARTTSPDRRPATLIAWLRDHRRWRAAVGPAGEPSGL